ncbi:protein YIPF3-like isoform X1 [Ciona intestinalis]
MSSKQLEDWEGFSSNDEQLGNGTQFTKKSAIVDMSVVDDSSGTSSFEDVGEQINKMGKESDPSNVDLMTGIGGNLGKAVAGQMWENGQQQARKMIDIYANIDILRPYFDIEPKELLLKLGHSFVPLRTLSTPQKISGELYGPLMTVFTLIAILLMNMKTSGTVLEQGTLMGTAFGVCFGYWWGVAGFIYFLSYICNTYISIVQCLSMLGYGMVSHCVILLLGHFTHYSHGMFYILWAVVAGASAARMITILLSRTVGKSQRLLLCTSIASLHMLFLLYLHFAYHHVVESIIETFDEAGLGVPISVREIRDVNDSLVS